MYKAEDANKKTLFEKFTDWHRNRLYESQLIEPVVDYFEFPILWTRSRPLLQHLFFIYKAYLNEVKLFLAETECEGNAANNTNTNNLCTEIRDICNGIIGSLSDLYSMKEKDAEDSLHKVIKSIGINAKSMPFVINEGENKQIPKTLFKIRPNKKDLVCKSDFLHIPFNKRYLASQQRFSAMALPCLYLGFSKEVCIAEVGKSGSIAEFEINGPLNIIDLTLPKKNGEEKDNYNSFKLWPLLAACYVAVPRELDKGKKINFSEEYLFPQLLTRTFVKIYLSGNSKHNETYGICYYSCRNKELDPMVDTYKNLVLFAKEQIPQEMDITEDYNFAGSSAFDTSLEEKIIFKTAYNL